MTLLEHFSFTLQITDVSKLMYVASSKFFFTTTEKGSTPRFIDKAKPRYNHIQNRGPQITTTKGEKKSQLWATTQQARKIKYEVSRRISRHYKARRQ